MKISSDERLRRRYSCRVRACACGAKATYAVQVMARTIGPGQSGENRRIRLGKTSVLCDQCSREVTVFAKQLGESVYDAIDRINQTARATTPTPLLF